MINQARVGYMYMVLSAFSFCMMTVFVKIAGKELATIQIVFVRGILTFIFTYFILRKYKISIWGKDKSLLSLRGVVGTIALFFVYESLRRLSIAEATVIQYLYPIFTAGFAAIILKERVGKKIYYAIFLGLIGVYVLLDFPFININTSINIDNIVIAILGAIFTGLSYVLVRMASNKNESPYVIMFYFPVFTILMSLPIVFQYWVWPSIYCWFILVFAGICTQFGQLWLTFGYRLLPASKAAPISYVQVPFAAIVSVLLFNEALTYNLILGPIIIYYGIYTIVRTNDQRQDIF